MTMMSKQDLLDLVNSLPDDFALAPVDYRWNSDARRSEFRGIQVLTMGQSLSTHTIDLQFELRSEIQGNLKVVFERQMREFFNMRKVR